MLNQVIPVTAIFLLIFIASRSYAEKDLRPQFTEPMLTKKVQASIFEMESQKKKKLFEVTRSVKKDSDLIQVEWTTQGSKPPHQKVLMEEYVYENRKLKSGSLLSHQTGVQENFVIKDQKIFFTKKGKGSEVEKDDEDLEENTIVKDQIIAFIMEHWAVLVQGETIGIRLIVPSRLETVGFKFFKSKEFKHAEGQDVIEIKMKPSSIFIAAIVDPIRFIFNKQPPHGVLEFKGRVAPKIKKGDKWADLDAHTVYHY